MALENYGRIMQGAADFAMQPYNALQQGRQDAAQNRLMDLRAQSMQNELDDDAEWDAAVAAKDVDTMMRIAPRETQMILEHWQTQAMSGLGEIPITAQKIDMAPLQKQENWAYEQSQQRKNQATQNYFEAQRLNLARAQEDRLSAPPTAEPKWRGLTPEEMKAGGYPQGAVVQRNSQTGEEKVVSKASPVNQNVAAKVGAVRTLNYVTNRFEQHLGTVKTGGFMGARGMVSKVSDSQDSMRFDNLREQLSTELRTIFRIPGEGALSDKEQAQYGLQLPDMRYDKTTNMAILNDIKQRASLRMKEPDPVDPAQSDVVDFNDY